MDSRYDNRSGGSILIFKAGSALDRLWNYLFDLFGVGQEYRISGYREGEEDREGLDSGCGEIANGKREEGCRRIEEKVTEVESHPRTAAPARGGHSRGEGEENKKNSRGRNKASRNIKKEFSTMKKLIVRDVARLVCKVDEGDRNGKELDIATVMRVLKIVKDLRQCEKNGASVQECLDRYNKKKR